MRSDAWVPTPLGRLYRVSDIRAGHLANELPLMSVSQYAGVVPRAGLMGDAGRAEDLSNYKVCEIGDLVLNRMSAYNGALGVAQQRGLVSPDYLVMRPTADAEAGFLARWLKTPLGVSEMTKRLRGIGSPDAAQIRTPRINHKDLRSITLGLPSLDEQRAIADFLDRETSQMDALIGKQERLIETLRERRVSVVARALMFGIDPDAPLTSDGAGDFERIPAHWRVVPTRHLCSVTTGDEDSGNAVEDGDYPFFVRGREILRSNRYAFDCEAVMTPGDGQGGTGKVFHYYLGKFVAHQRVYVYRDFKGVLGWYYFYFLSTFLRPVALAGSNTVTMESLRRPLLADFKVAVPPLDEQRRIADYLDEQTAKIDTLIAKAERFIEVSKERRSALITAAVTGQIDVRNRVAAEQAQVSA